MWKSLISLSLFSEGLFITCCSSGDIKSEGDPSPVCGRNFDQQAVLSGAHSAAESTEIPALRRARPGLSQLMPLAPSEVKMMLAQIHGPRPERCLVRDKGQISFT